MTPYYEQDGIIWDAIPYERNNMQVRMRANCERINAKWTATIYKWAQPKKPQKDESTPRRYIGVTKTGMEDQSAETANRNQASQRTGVCCCQGSCGQGAVETRTRYCGRDKDWTTTEGWRDRPSHQRRSFRQPARQFVCLPQSVASQRGTSVRGGSYACLAGSRPGRVSGGLL